MSRRVIPGVEMLLRDPGKFLDSPNVGLITNPTGVNSGLVSTMDAFQTHPKIELKALFGPEHGITGEAQDTITVGSYIDPDARIPVYSLYGATREPTEEMLEGVDVLVFDIQDIGTRYYTYVSTLTYALKGAADQGIPLLVLDRPNPINGISVEGDVLEAGFESFVGLHPIPIRHGLTMGELALLMNEEAGAELRIAEVEGWRRGMWFDETGLPWVQPSPNMPTLETATVYPGTCLFEGVNISEGRGTTRPFECIGAPWMDGRRWFRALNELDLAGVHFRSCYFTPTFSKYAGERCEGTQVHVTDRDAFRPVEVALHMLATALDHWPNEFEWLPPSYDERLHFDLLAGTDKTREALSRGVAVEDIVRGWEEGLKDFIEARERYLLYPEGSS